MLVQFFATYRQIAGCKSCEIPVQEDVLALLKELSERWPEFRIVLMNADETDASDYIAIMVNGRYIEHLDGVATKLAECDEIALIPSIAGG